MHSGPTGGGGKSTLEGEINYLLGLQSLLPTTKKNAIVSFFKKVKRNISYFFKKKIIVIKRATYEIEFMTFSDGQIM